MSPEQFAQQQRLEKLAMRQKEGDARLGKEDEPSSPRGLHKRLKEMCRRMRSMFPRAPQMVPVPSWIRVLAARLWQVILRIVLGRATPPAEREPQGWPPSWPVLMPLEENLRRLWKIRFGKVMAEAQTLKQEADKRRKTAAHYDAEANRKQDRIDNARRVELPAQRLSEPTAPEDTLFARVIEFFRTWRLEALFPSGGTRRPRRSESERGPRIVTLDDVLKRDVGKPFSDVEIQQKFASLMEQCQQMLARIDKGMQEIGLGAHGSGAQ
jgi:hypothetical protein